MSKGRGPGELNCPKCNFNDVSIKKSEVTSEIKNRVINYEQEMSKCNSCGFEFFTPTQLDSNNSSLKKAYEEMVN